MSNELLTPLYDKKETCPNCKTTFTTKKIRSRFIKLDHSDTDFCPYYNDENINPLLYFVKVCPSCGYSYTDQFTAYFIEGTQDAIREGVTEKWVAHNFGGERSVSQAIQTYKLAFYCATLKNEKSIIIANLLLRLTWLCRKINDHNGEKRFTELALEHLNKAYLDAYYGNTADMTEIRVLYLIGELNRRLGHYDQAVTHFSKVVDMQNNTLERKVVNLARQQWYAARDEKRSMQNETDTEAEE